MTEIAVNYPLYIILTLLGLPESDFPRMLKLTQEMFGANDQDLNRSGAEVDPKAAAESIRLVVMDLARYFGAIIEDRRRDPKDDLASVRLRAFTERLVRGVAANREALDKRLGDYLKNWPMHRLGGVERNVMRLAFYELFFETETPPVVCINEAVDLAKYFSNADAGRFVNGVLDRAAKDANRPARK